MGFLVFSRHFVKLIATEHGAVLTNVLIADVTSAALANTAFHTELHCSENLRFVKAKLN